MYDIGGLNLYAYCDNNPVSGRDDNGRLCFWKKLAIAVAVVAVVAVAAAVVAVASGGTTLCAIGTVFYGAAQGAVAGAVTGAASGAVIGAVQGAVEGYQKDGWEGVLTGAGRGALKGAVQGAQDGFISGFVAGGITTGISAAQGNTWFCFVAGTTVLTTLGKKTIETIRVGDTIPCVDHITGESAEKRVVSTSVNKVDTIVELTINGESIQCTDTHPFQVKGKGWVNAGDLQVGDLFYDKEWNTATVERIHTITLGEPIEVYNFEVEDGHTYFVGDGLWLVHNACPAAKKAQLPTEGKIRYVPPKNSPVSLPRTSTGGYLDKFGNIWQKGPSRTVGELFEWDVQLSKRGQRILGWLSRDGKHINVSLKGRLTHL